MRRAALVTFLLGLAAFLLFIALPWLNRERDFPASVTSPAAREVVSLVPLRPRQRLCMSQIAIEPLSRVARFRLGSYGKRGPALRVALSGADYRVTREIAAGWPDNLLQEVRVSPPPRAELIHVCVTNRGPRKAAFYAAEDRAQSRSRVTVDGKRVAPTPQFGFWEGSPHSIADRVSITADRMAVFRGPFAHVWLIWLIVGVGVTALTAGVAALIVLSGRPRSG